MKLIFLITDNMAFTTKHFTINDNSNKPAPTTYSFRQVAEILDLGIGRNKLMEVLRNAGILNIDGLPYDKYVNDGYFSFRKRLSYRYSFAAASVMGKGGLKFIEKIVNNYLKQGGEND